MEDVVAWAHEIGLVTLPPRRDDLIHVADSRSGYSIAEHHGLYAVEQSTREHDRVLLGAFDDVEDARRFLVMEFGAVRRSRESLQPLRPERTPPGYVLEDTPTSIWLSWLTGSAEFPADDLSRRRAVTFARVERAPVDAIHAAFLEPAGRPLFDAA